MQVDVADHAEHHFFPALIALAHNLRRIELFGFTAEFAAAPPRGYLGDVMMAETVALRSTR